MGRPRLHPSTPEREQRRAAWRQKYYDRDPISCWCGVARVSAMRRARKSGITFDLSVEDIRDLLAESDMICPIFQTPLRLGRGHRVHGDNSATVDRLNNNLGYTKDNCHIISMHANRSKSQMSLEQMILMGRFAEEKLHENMKITNS